MNIYRKYTFFWKGPFSQWTKSKFIVDGIEYNCAEQYMMAEKARLFGDNEILAKIMESKNPNKQKNLGRKVRGFKKEIWEKIESNGKPRCWNIVRKGNFEKFKQNNLLLDELLKTEGTLLVEASPVDTIWGIGLAEDDPLIIDKANWHGTNWLGEVLTDVREEFLKLVKDL